MIISIGAGCFVASFVFSLWEQQGFVPVNSYPIKLLLDLNFHSQFIQKWKKLKAYIWNWQNRQLLLFIFFWAGWKLYHCIYIKKKIYWSRYSPKGTEADKISQKAQWIFQEALLSFTFINVCLFSQGSAEPCILHSFSIVNIVSVLPLLHQTRFLSDCWRQLVQHKKVCVFICCGQTLRKDESM